jgi:L-aminopeptidase/D-esterase-like protein
MIKKRELHPLEGVLVGQAEDLVAMTGCTVVIVPDGAVCGVSVFGGSPCTRDTDALDPISNRTLTHAVVLTGGSCFGLSAVIGVETLLEERGIGRNVGVTVVPNISAAALFDLRCGSASRRPDAEMGRAAALNAFYGFPFVSGNHGAGTGATIGKTNGLERSMK